MVEIIFGDWDDLMKRMAEASRAADERVRPAQAAIRPGEYFINYKPEYGLFIFGKILDYRTLGVDPEEQEYVNESYEQPHMKYYKPSHAFSVACPMGEYGDVHVCEIDVVMDKELFDFYRENNWSKPRNR